MKEELRKHISHAALLPLSQFTDDESLKQKRPYFGYISKIAMLVDATYSRKTEREFEFDEYDMELLDCVNDFVEYLKSKGITKINKPPEGYK